MDGLTFLSRLMKHFPLPVVVVSSVTPQGSEAAVRALELGAVDVVSKPGAAYTVAEVTEILAQRIRTAARAKCRPASVRRTAPVTSDAPLLRMTHKLLAIGASTGGTQAISQVLSGLPVTTPGTLVVQHMPEQFTAAFARRLDGISAMEVREAREGDTLTPGLALLAPGNRHMVLRRNGTLYEVQLKDGPPVHYQRPSVDVMFQSVARHAGPNAVGVILTGMGADGARGLLAMKEAGARTLAQDEASCVVYGMPREAAKLGAADEVCALSDVPQRILAALAAGQNAAA